MPIDGSYGRLSAHNQRVKELKYKKTERQKNIKKTIRLSNTKIGSEKYHDPENVRRVKEKIIEKAKQKRKNEFIIYFILTIISIVCVYFFFKWLTIL